MSDMVRIRTLAPAEAAASIDALGDLLIDCVAGGASVSFMLPIARETALRFWKGVAESVAREERVLLVAESAGLGIRGTVQLVVSQPENQPHRADVSKLLVHREARRQGIAAALMAAAEEQARAHGKTLLVLDTVTDGDGARVYQRAGWQRVGDIPDYALTPDGMLCSTTYYYKRV